MSIFTQVKRPKVGVSKFNLSHDIKTSFDMGELIPTMVMDVLPGDTFTIKPENFLRFSPLTTPVMHKINVTHDFFFVPNRLLWDKWEDFITGNDTEVAVPTINTLNLISTGSLGDYMGLPIDMNLNQPQVSAFPFAAYSLIYSEWYRDQNLITDAFQKLLNGDNNAYAAVAQGPPAKRAWMHDYLTSCLPFAQKGDAVQLPLTNTATIPVEYAPSGEAGEFKDATTGIATGSSGSLQVNTDGDTELSGVDVSYDPKGSLEVDLNAESVLVTTLRRALALQRWFETNAVAGTRYIESMWAHFQQKSSDARLNRPEFIGRQTQNMVISEVLSTAQTSENGSDTILNPVGQMAGHGISVGGGKPMRYHAEEHGWIIGIINVQPITSYQQGIARKWSREDSEEYFWPTFQDIGEQAVKVKELWNGGVSQTDLEETFGYIPRYSEYKYEAGRVSGEMRTTLDDWHLARQFATKPTLNKDFINCDPSRRIFAVTDPNVDTIYAHIFLKVNAIRKMKKHSSPHIM